LHGGGGRGTDNIKHLDQNVDALVSQLVQGIEPTFVLAPHCPPGDQWVNGAKSLPFVNYDQSQVPESDAAKQVRKVLALTQAEYAIDSARIYITGPSMGGSGSWDYVTRYPGIFAAAVTVNGVNDPSRASMIARLPIWSFHGTDDQVSPVGNTRAMVAALRALGSPVRYTELDGQGHLCDAAAYKDRQVWSWLLAQHRP
jgi:predicted peptidase